MNKDIIRIASAIAVGTTIGGFIARLVNPHIWFLGVVIGGLLAYLSFCWKEVGSAIKKASHEAVVVRNPGYFRLVFARDWSQTVALLSMMVTVYFHVAVLAFVISLRYPAGFKLINLIVDSAIVGVAIEFIVIGLIQGTAHALDAMNEQSPESKWKIRKTMLRNYVNAKENFLPNALRREFQGLVWLVTRIPHGSMLVFRLAVSFIKTVFITIHSEMRLICGIDTAIGISVGYWLGQSTIFTIVGSVIGIVVGLLNYYVVSIRWLKLKPV